MPDNEIDIVIRTRAELEGAKQLRTELEKQIGQAKALGKEHRGLSADLEKVTHSVKHANPELGHFTRMLSSLSVGGPIGAVAAIAAAFVGVAKAILSVTHELLPFGEAVSRTGENLEKQAQRVDRYRQSVERLKVAADLANLKSQGAFGAMSAANAAEGDVADAHRDRQIAEIDNAVAAGTMTKAEGDIRKGQIEGEYTRGKAERDKKAIEIEDHKSRTDAETARYNAIVKQNELDRFEKASGFAGVQDLSQFSKKAAEDKDALDKTLARRQQLKALIDEDDTAVTLSPSEALARHLQRTEHETQLEGIEGAIPQLEALARRSAERAGSAEIAKSMREGAQTAKDTAATAQQTYENAHADNVIRRAAIDRRTPEQLRALNLRTGTAVIGDVNEQLDRNAANAQQFLSTGIWPSSNVVKEAAGRAVAAVVQNTEITVESFRRITDSLTRQNQAIKELQGQTAFSRNLQ